MATSSEPIKHTDLAEEDVAGNMRESLASVIPIVEKLNSSLIETAKLTKGKLINMVGPTELKGVQDLNKELTKTDTIVKANIKTKQALTVTQAANNKAIREENELAKQTAILMNAKKGSVERLRAELALITIEWKKTSDAEQLDANVTGSLAQQKKILTEQLKHLEGVTGDHRREVGNYSKSLVILGKGLGGVTGLFATLGRTLGLNLEYLEGFHEASKELIKVSKELSHAKHLEHLAHKENSAAIVEETAAEEAEGVAKTASLGVIGLVVAATAALAAGIWYLINAQEESYQETLKDTIAQNANTEALRKNIIARAELDKKLIETKQKTLVERGLIGEAESERDKLLMEFNIERAKLESERLKQIEDEKVYYMEQKHLGVRNATKYHEDKLIYIEQNYQSHLKEMTRQYYADKELIDTKAQLQQAEDLDKNFDKQLEKQKKNAEKYKEELKKEHEKIAQMLKDLNENILPGSVKYEEEVDDADKARQKEFDTEIENRVNHAAKSLEVDKQTMKDEAELDKKRREKKINDAVETEKEINDILTKIADERIRYQEESLNRQLSNIDNAIKIQQDRFNQGLSNTLAFELKEKAKAQEKQALLDKKAHKEKQAEQLAEVFMEFAKVYAKDGPAGFAKAIASTFGVKAFELALAGSAYDGTEDTGPGKGMDSKNGMLWMVHPNERILTAEQNAMIGDLSNDELVDMVTMRNNNFIVPEAMQGNDLSLMRVVSELQDVKKAIEDKPVFNWEVNKYDELVQNKLEKGNKTTTVYKRWGGT